MHLGNAAAEVLRALPRVAGNPFVVVGKNDGQHLTDLQHPWRRIRAAADLDDVRIHDLRHTFASGGLAVGEGLPMIGKLLGHTQVQTTARYAHLASDPVKHAADKIAGRLAAALLAPIRGRDVTLLVEPDAPTDSDVTTAADRRAPSPWARHRRSSVQG